MASQPGTPQVGRAVPTRSLSKELDLSSTAVADKPKPDLIQALEARADEM